MSYIIIEDFKAGLDRRKLAAASPQGTLQTLNNAHITRGGEIEKRLAWVPKYALPAGQTFGFAGANGTLHTFGSAAAPAVPPGVVYQQLAAPAAATMLDVVCCEFFDGKAWVIADFDDGERYEFYDGVRLTDFDLASGAVAVQGSRPGWVLTHDEKLYVIHSSILAFSAIEAPDKFKDHGAGEVGFGFKNMSNQAAGSETLTAIGRYQDLLAIFARRNIQTWYLDPDPLENVKKQNLENIGTFAPKSVVPFGDLDLFFLADSGIRSLRARDSSNQAGMSDVGTPIDDFLLDYLSTLSETQKARAVGCLEPLSGRYFLAVGMNVFVFSFFPSSHISAWSTYSLPAEISDLSAVDGRVWARMGDTIYLLGGEDGKTYDSSKVDVDLPYIDGRAIATFKNYKAIDIVCQGEWSIFVNTDPDEPEAETEIAIVNNTSLTKDMIGFDGHSPLVKFRLENRGSGPARLSKIIVHYDSAEAT